MAPYRHVVNCNGAYLYRPTREPATGEALELRHAHEAVLAADNRRTGTQPALEPVPYRHAHQLPPVLARNRLQPDGRQEGTSLAGSRDAALLGDSREAFARAPGAAAIRVPAAPLHPRVVMDHEGWNPPHRR